jgi:hypothetical protein
MAVGLTTIGAASEASRKEAVGKQLAGLKES